MFAVVPSVVSIFDPEILKEEPTLDAVVVAASTVSRTLDANLLTKPPAFAAGAMIFVVVEEVIPETQQDQYTDVATLGFILGFIVMMTLDVSLG